MEALMSQSRYMVAVLLVVGVAGTDLFAEAEPQAQAEPAAPRSVPDEQARRALQALIAGLGDPRFSVREETTKKLEQSGIEAVAPLAAAAGGERLEVTCRAIRVLGHYLESSDDAVFDSTERALEGLEESSNRSAARRAAEALLAQSARRWKRAAVRIRDLGGELRWTDREGNPAFRVQDPDRAGRPFVVIPPEWKGGDAGLVNLKRMARQFSEGPLLGLPSLYLIDGAPVSPEAIDKLRDSLPALDVQRRGAARLGVSCASEFRTCRVSGIEPESPAQKAGILPNDEIVTFDGESLVSEGGNGDSAFARLIQITGRHKAGDKVEIEVMRASKRIKIEAELIGWTSAKPNEEKK